MSSPSWKDRAQKIHLLLLDVDGVLTDGRIAYDEGGREIKFFDVRDGQGIKLLQAGGIEVGILSSRRSGAVTKRAEELGILLLREGVRDKGEEVERIREERKMAMDQIGYVGDDWVDLPVFARVGFAVAVPESIPEVRAKAHYITSSSGGRGAVREICEAILKAQGIWERVTERFWA